MQILVSSKYSSETLGDQCGEGFHVNSQLNMGQSALTESRNPFLKDHSKMTYKY